MKLSIVIPAYNEEQRLTPTLDAYVGHFVPRYGDDFEIIVVVNGSSDRTEDVAGTFAARHSQVEVVVEPGKVGKGGAIILGFKAATGDKIGFTDADGSTPPEAFQKLIDRLDGEGAIIASRWLKESQVSPRQPRSRRIASRVFNALVRFLFGLRITDTQCGAKVLSRKALDEVLPVLGLTKWAFDVDLLFQLRRAGYPIEEVPTIWHDAAGSKIDVPRASTEMLLAIIRLRLIYSPFSWVVSAYHGCVRLLRRG